MDADLKSFCDHFGMFQLIREPTRYEYLLDLVLTDVCKCTVKVLPRIADHNPLLVKLPITEILETTISREVWMLADADWKSLQKVLKLNFVFSILFNVESFVKNNLLFTNLK